MLSLKNPTTAQKTPQPQAAHNAAPQAQAAQRAPQRQPQPQAAAKPRPQSAPSPAAKNDVEEDFDYSDFEEEK